MLGEHKQKLTFAQEAEKVPPWTYLAGDVGEGNADMKILVHEDKSWLCKSLADQIKFQK